MAEPAVTIDAALLAGWAGRVLVARGLPADDAATAAGLLVRTSQRGIDTHGISLLPLYARMLASGEMKAAPQVRLERRGATLFYDADNGLAQVTAVAALREAMRMTDEQPMVTCLVSRCGHLAALGSIALLAAEAGKFAFVCQSTSPFMALPGWTGKAIGNNPLAFAAPLAGRPPLVFDMAASVVARGQVAMADREGRPLPEGWAIGPDGSPTTDAAAALAGAVLPVGDYKGMGLAMLVQCLVSSMLGLSPELAEAAGERMSEMGAFMLVIDPMSASRGRFAPDIDFWLAGYLDAAGDSARYPGQRAAECEVERRHNGIPLPPELLGRLRQLGDSLSQPLDI